MNLIAAREIAGSICFFGLQIQVSGYANPDEEEDNSQEAELENAGDGDN